MPKPIGRIRRRQASTEISSACLGSFTKLTTTAFNANAVIQMRATLVVLAWPLRWPQFAPVHETACGRLIARDLRDDLRADSHALKSCA